jgi:ketosteroid isomerase-like protein
MNDAIEARLATLETQLTELQDREAIRNLIASYGPLADCGDADRVAGLWQDDGVYEVGGFGASQGPRGDCRADRRRHPPAADAGRLRHTCSAPCTFILKAGRAVAVGHSCVLRHRDGGFEAYRVSANRWELTKDADGTWRVSKRSNRLLDGNPLAPALLRP